MTCGALLAGAAQAKEPADGLWHGEISLGGSIASGTNSTQSLNTRAQLLRRTELDRYDLRLLANHGSSRVDGVRERTDDLLRVGGRYERNAGTSWYGFVGAEGETQRSAGVKARSELSGGAGWHWLREERDQFKLFAGIGWGQTRFTDGSRRQGASLLIGEESSHQLGESALLKQRLELLPADDELGLRARFDTSLSTAVADGWTLNAGLSLRYTERVPAAQSRQERLLTIGFGRRF